MSSDRKKSFQRTLPIDSSAITERMRQATRGQACFIVIGGLDVGRIIPLDEATITMGRDPECDVVLRDDGVSRFHAEVCREETNRVAIRDLGSTNGTFVGGVQIKDARLADGNKVLIGRRTILKFGFQDELEQQYQQLMYESSTKDGLTDTYNRRYFAQRLVNDLSFARRQQIPCTLAIFDIDFFKRVNDTYGHRTGDQVLVTVTEAVRGIVRTEDVLARYGGEEFAVIAQGTDFEGGRSLGERIRACIEQRTVEALDETGKIFGVTVSVGVATVSPEAQVDSAEIISAADANLYEAKRSGRNRVVASEIR